MRELERGVFSIRQIARTQKVSCRRVRQLREHQRQTGQVFALSKVRIKRLKPPTFEEIQLVLDLRKEQPLGSTFLELILRKHGTPIPHNRIQKILNAYGEDKPLKKKIKRKDWVRWERKHSNSLWHVDWTKIGDEWFIAYIDDASRFIVGCGKFKSANVENSLAVLRGAIMAFGKPKAILSGHDVQFFSNATEEMIKGPNGFQRFLEANGIQHILGRIDHPQTNGKVERFFGTVKSKLKHFKSLDDLVHWYNYLKPHMSLNLDELETPAQAYARKMHHMVKSAKRQTVIVEVSK